MAQTDVLDYIRKTPYNSNVNVVKGMLNAEGSGGSSDFSTAQVTIVNNTESTQGVGLDGGIARTQEGFAFLIESGGNGVLRTRVGVAPNTTSVFTALLINSSDPEAPSDKLAVYSVFSDNGEITTDGNCMLVDVSGPVIVWGDCTITVNESR